MAPKGKVVASRLEMQLPPLAHMAAAKLHSAGTIGISGELAPHGKKIPPVPVPVPDPEQVLDCEFQLEAGFNELSERTLAVGWSNDEVEAALLRLARHRVLARIVQERTGG